MSSAFALIACSRRQIPQTRQQQERLCVAMIFCGEKSRHKAAPAGLREYTLARPAP